MRLKKNVLPTLVLALALLVPALAFAGAGQVVVNTATVTADNQLVGGGADAASATTAVTPGVAEEVPTLSQWGLIALALVLGGLGVARMRRPATSPR